MCGGPGAVDQDVRFERIDQRSASAGTTQVDIVPGSDISAACFARGTVDIRIGGQISQYLAPDETCGAG